MCYNFNCLFSLFFAKQRHIERLLGRPLSPKEMTTYLSWQDEFNFSSELILILLEYCVSRGKSDYRYIEKVAIAWHDMNITTIDDGKTLNEAENIHASLIGLAVDNLTRFMMGTSVEEAFKISLQGALCLDLFLNNASGKKGLALGNAKKLLKGIKGLDNESVSNACKLVGYDVCFRAGVIGYKPVEEIKPDSDTIENIAIMVKRSLAFWKEYGPITQDGFTFEGGYTDIVSSGDGDYLTEDTLWDFKVSKEEPKSKYTLQLLMYYIMGCHSIHPEFQKIEKLGIFNPRKNKVYIAEISSINPEVIEKVSQDIIGYK